MKTRVSTLLAILIAFAEASVRGFAGEASELNSLPPPVQKTAREIVGGAKIEEVEDTVEEGKRAYEVEFERNGKEMAIVISGDGKLIQTEERMSVGDAPEKIKQAVTKQFPEGTISHIKKIEKAGKTFFEISVQAAGKAHPIKLDGEGRSLP